MIVVYCVQQKGSDRVTDEQARLADASWRDAGQSVISVVVMPSWPGGTMWFQPTYNVRDAGDCWCY